MASIKALELVVREITGEKDIQKGIGSLENKGIKLHSQFQQAIINLYRFTSADGVRHAHPNPVQNDEETALFMLVVCSAIINFIEARLPKQNSKCRVGMTTDPNRRKAHWENKISNITDWEWFGPYDSREEAQAFETHLASIHGCESHPGGRDPEGNKKWWVYKFIYLEKTTK